VSRMKLPRERGVRWVASSGMTQLALACVIFGLDLASTLTGGNAIALLLSVVLCVAAAASGVTPRVAGVVTSAALVPLALLTPAEVGAALYAPLVTILGCVILRTYRWAVLVSVVGLAVSVYLSWLRTPDWHTDVLAVLMWTGVYALPWLVGLAFRQQRITERQSLVAELDSQRREIAGELHDNLAHDLAIIVMLSEKAQLHKGDIDDDLQQLASAARRSSTQLRNLMGLLSVQGSSPLLSLDTTWVEAAETLRAAGFRPHVEVAGDLTTVRPAIGDALARVAREATNNIVRHGDPSAPCFLTLAVSQKTASMSFVNASGEPAGPWRLGLSGIRHRIHASDGTMTVTPDSGSWTLDVSVPLR